MWLARHRRLTRIILAATAIYLLLCLLGAVAFVEFSLRLPKRRLSAAQIAQVKSRAAEAGLQADEVRIPSQDHLSLRGWFARPPAHNGRVVVLLHGVTDNRLGVAGFAEFFLRNGYGVLLPDSRTHGESEGVVATYGIAEADDVHRWVDWVYRIHQPTCVYGFGESMGAAILLQSLAREPRFCAVIAESPFADFREAVYDRISGGFGTGPWLARTFLRPTVEAGFLYARWRYAVDFAKSSPRDIVSRTAVPVFLIHGELDPVIGLRNSQSIHAANRQSVLWAVPRAYHCGAWSTEPQQFESRVLAWFDAHPSRN
jgi:uncharacterized protein